MTTYAPGTVCVATVRGVPNVRIFRHSDGWCGTDQCWYADSGYQVTHIRPLVVLDLESPSDAVRTLRQWIDQPPHSYPTCIEDIADQIEAQTAPPKPPEPTGLGAVVQDADGIWWCRVRNDTDPEPAWQSVDGTPMLRRSYTSLNVVRVLSEGAQP